MFKQQDRANTMTKEMIDIFIQNMIRPEVRALIMQYALASPFKKDILQSAIERKKLLYEWSFSDKYCQLWRLNFFECKINERWSLMLEELNNGSVECFVNDTVSYEVDLRPDNEMS